MSEPPLKKKRTILDFFSCTGKQGKMATRSETKNKRETEDEAKEIQISKKKSEPEASTSKQGPTVNKNEKPGLRKKTEQQPSGSGIEKNPTEPLEQTQELDGSQDLFPDFTDENSETNNLISTDIIPNRKPSQMKAGSNAWKGTPLKTLNKIADCLGDLGTLHTTEHHTVLFKTPFKYDGQKPPTPYHQYKDRWDCDHVRMPCSNQNEYPVAAKRGESIVRRRWEIIQETLLENIPGPFELEEAILTYNSRYFEKWNFSVLHQFFTDELEEEERNHFFNVTLKNMAKLALQLPHLCSCPIPLLKKGQNRSITFSQQQIACLLANAFFCTFPRRNTRQRSSEYSNYPSINFNTLFMGQPTKAKLEKMKCIVHYFTRVLKDMPKGTVTFTRQCITKMPHWDDLDTSLKGLYVSSEGTIEDDGEGFLQVDFANRVIGGGVLGQGCVQEEIRFLICPEMLITRLFTEVLEKNECLIMFGCERFSNYDGYAASFKWKDNHLDKTERDGWGRICCEVVAIDALVIHDYKSQFTASLVKRELNKAYCGFMIQDKKQYRINPAVCTGNWGCGAFGGDKRLKALIQLMAAAQARRDTCYFTFDDEALRDELHAIHKYLTTDNVLSIGDLMKLIEQYRKSILGGFFKKSSKMTLFEYIVKAFDGSLVDTDDSSNQSSGSLEIQRQQEEMDEQLALHCMSSDWEQDLKKENSVDYKANTP